MNILFCGDSHIEDGLTLAVLSLARTTDEPLCIYVLTMHLETAEKQYSAVPKSCIRYLDSYVAEKNPESFVRAVDVGDLVRADLPLENMDTRFTPYCMLRLYADLVPEIPDRILYLDTDVLFRKSCMPLYCTDVSDAEFAGVLDYYGSWFFRQRFYRRDYVNSGVLLLNMAKIRESGLFLRCREVCRDKRMFMPDQSALNKLSTAKVFLPRRFNEQRRLREDTVIQHFTTSFRFFPWLHSVTVKPWDVERVHSVLKLYEYDELYAEFFRVKKEMAFR